MKVDYCRVSLGGLHGKHVVATGKGKTGTIPAFAENVLAVAAVGNMYCRKCVSSCSHL
jgi:hypothetical protein